MAEKKATKKVATETKEAAKKTTKTATTKLLSPKQ